MYRHEHLGYDTDEGKYVEKDYVRDNVVKHYKEDNKLKYPLIMLSADKIETFRLEALKGMLRKPKILEKDEGYYVYLKVQGHIIGVGVLPGIYLKAVLDSKVFKVFDKAIWLDKDTCYKGYMLYALCTASVS